MPAVQQQRVLTPFRDDTRLRIQQIPVQSGAAQTANGAFSAEVPKAGYLESILIRVSGTVQIGTTAGHAFLHGWPWNVLSSINVRVNVGAATIYSTSGYGNYIVQRMRNRFSSPTKSVGYNAASGNLGAMVGVTDGNVQGWCSPRNGCIQMCSGFQGLGSQLDYAPVNVAINPWQLTYEIPIAANMGDEFLFGLINMQAPELLVTVEGNWGPVPSGTQILGGVGTVTPSLSMDMLYRYYDIPTSPNTRQPDMALHRIIENRQTVPATGDLTYTVPREGVLFRLAHIFSNSAGAMDDSAFGSGNVRLIFNKSEMIQNVPHWYHKWAQNRLFGELPYGVLAHDLWAAQGNGGMPGWGDSRDMINSEDIATFESVVNLNAIGTSPVFDTIREFGQQLSM